MKYVKYAAVAALFALAAAACCPCRKTAGSAPPPPAKGTTYRLVTMEGVSHIPGENYSIVFGEDNRFSGVGDCNRLMGSYELSTAGSLSLSGVASTRMMCPDQSKEDRFVRLLGEVDAYSIDKSNGLLMLMRDGQAVLVFEPVKGE